MDGKFTLSFSRKVENKKLNASALSGSSEEPKTNREIIESIEENVIKSNAPKQEDLVIPLPEEEKASIVKRLRKITATKIQTSNDMTVVTKAPDMMTQDELAAKALLQEAQGYLNDAESHPKSTAITIPPASHAIESSVDIIQSSSLQDYERIAVSNFGTAMLRGMGWNNDGVGKESQRRIIPVFEPTTKMLHNTSKPKANNATYDELDELPVVVHAYVYVHQGRNRGVYGTVEAVEEDHVLIRRSMCNSGTNKDLPALRDVEANITVVTEEHYKQNSRVINKELYDKAKLAVRDSLKRKKCANSLNKVDFSDGRNLKHIQYKSEESVLSNKTEADINTDCTQRCESNYSNANTNSKNNPVNMKKEESTEDCKTYEERSVESKIDTVSKYEGNKCAGSSREDRDRKHESHQMSKYKYRDMRENNGKFSNDYKRRRKSDIREMQYYNETDKVNTKSSKLICKEQKEIKDKYLERKYGCASKGRICDTARWVREGLMVRIISQQYKKGRYFKQKARVETMLTPDTCDCRTNDGKLLHDIPVKELETVIPKQHPRIVLVLQGSYAGQLAEVLEQHKESEQVTVQLLQDKSELARLSYDDVCQYEKPFL